MQQRSIPPRALSNWLICEIGSCGSSELWNLRDCGTAISALLREAVIAKILYETLLLSCVAAFALGVVIAAASVFRLGGGLAAGAKCPPACARGCKTGGAHSPFLLVVARVSLGLSGAWAGHTLARR